VDLTANLTLQTKMADNQNTKQKDAEKKLIPQTTAGVVKAMTLFQGAADVIQFVQELDSAITQIANIDFSKGVCKQVKDPNQTPLNEQDSASNAMKKLGVDYLNALTGCSPIGKGISKIVEESNKEEKSAQDITKAVIDTVISAADTLLGPPRFPACAEEQYRKFLSALPIQYYLLIALSKLAQEIKDPIILDKEVDGPCGERLKQTKTFENTLPNFELPLIPELPYINIPSIEDVVDRLLSELICIGICIATTPIIKNVAEVLTSLANQWAEPTDDEFFNNYPPLRKIPINSYLNEEAIDAVFDAKLASRLKVDNKDIRDFLQLTQFNPEIFQEEFIFLFLGKGNCNIINKILKQQITKDLINKNVKISDEKEIMTFFQTIGSFVNFVELINNSKAEICVPDPCDLKPEELDDILSNINDLCSLLNPELGLPELPLGSFLGASGANDFVSDSTYENFRNLGSLFAKQQFYLQDKNTKTYLPIEPFIAAQVNATRIVLASLTDNIPLINELQQKQQNFLSVVFPFMLNQITFAYPDKKFTTKIITGPAQDAKKLPSNDSYPDGADGGGQPYWGYGPALDKKILARTQAVRYEKYTKDEIKKRFQLLQQNASTVSKDDPVDKFKKLKEEFKL
jgi:hypothetical protein